MPVSGTPSCIRETIMQESRESESPVTGRTVTEDLVRCQVKLFQFLMPASAFLYDREVTVLTACEAQLVPSQHLLLRLSESAPQEIPNRPCVCVP